MGSGQWSCLPPIPFSSPIAYCLLPIANALSSLMLQALTPGDCVLTGLCGIRDAVAGPPSGLLFLALGVVIAGGIGWSRARRRG